jgi:hypothetical protein
VLANIEALVDTDVTTLRLSLVEPSRLSNPEVPFVALLLASDVLALAEELAAAAEVLSAADVLAEADALPEADVLPEAKSLSLVLALAETEALL